MQIRPFTKADFKEVLSLLALSGIELPAEASDFGGVCLVAEDKGKIIGSLWALVGASSHAYLDYLAVDPEYRGQHVAWQLVMAMDAILKRLGVKRYTFYVEKHDTRMIEIMENHREANRLTKLRDLQFYRREIT